jgi:hypothetical protein
MPYATLEEFLVSAPLYRVEAFPSVRIHDFPRGAGQYIQAPSVLERECDKCGPTRWALEGGAYERRLHVTLLSHLTYKCKNCDDRLFHVWFRWVRSGVTATLVKAGQAGLFVRAPGTRARNPLRSDQWAMR